MIVKAYTHIGKRKVQQDSFRLDQETGFFVVCDGVGGSDDGAFASNYLTDLLFRERESLKDEATIKEVVLKGDQELKYKLSLDDAVSGYSTTVAILQKLHNNKFIISTVGDTRIYIFNPSTHTYFCTKDDSVVRQMIDNNLLPDDMSQKKHPLRNYVTRAIGSKSLLSIEDINIQTITIDDTQIILMCTDGVWEILDEHIILNQFVDLSIDEFYQSLRKLTESDATDNATFIIIDLRCAKNDS
jgi:serine/threonine protein phosphatase PrpC